MNPQEKSVRNSDQKDTGQLSASEFLARVQAGDQRALEVLNLARQEVLDGPEKPASAEKAGAENGAGILSEAGASEEIVINPNLGSGSKTVKQEQQAEKGAALHRTILQRALEILQGDEKVDDPFGLTEEVNNRTGE